MSDRIAIVTDIHASLQALEAALARIEELGIERIYCGGDLVGYGPHPNEACALLAERQIPTNTVAGRARESTSRPARSVPPSRRLRESRHGLRGRDCLGLLRSLALPPPPIALRTRQHRPHELVLDRGPPAHAHRRHYITLLPPPEVREAMLTPK